MRARPNRWPLAILTALAGTALAASALSAGCGGETDDGTVQPQPDTGTDTGVVIVDSTPPDTTPADSAKPDTATGGGSLFDAEIPDVVFDGGATAKGCYDCTLDKCKDEVEACDADERCRTLFLCILTDCGGSVSDYSCVLPCALAAGVSSPSDPVVTKAQAIGLCTQDNCKDACPALPTDGGAPDAPSGDASSDASDAGSAPDGSSAFKSSSPGSAAKSLDPKLVQILGEISAAYSSPIARQGMIDRFKR